MYLYLLHYESTYLFNFVDFFLSSYFMKQFHQIISFRLIKIKKINNVYTCLPKVFRIATNEKRIFYWCIFLMFLLLNCLKLIQQSQQSAINIVRYMGQSNFKVSDTGNISYFFSFLINFCKNVYIPTKNRIVCAYKLIKFKFRNVS